MLKKVMLMLIVCMGMATFANADEGVIFESAEHSNEYDLLEQAERLSKRMSYERQGVDVMFEHLQLFKQFGTEDDVKIFKASNAEILINKMIIEKKAQDLALTNAKNVLVNNNLWSGSIDTLFNAAWASVSSAAGGSRNFLLPAVWEIIKFSVNKGFQAYNMWDQYNYHMQDAKHHAETFDFYMQTLLKIQGNG
jgi:hypothetical protein